MSNHWVEGALSYYTEHLKVANTHKNKNTGMQKQDVLPTCMHQSEII